MLLLHEPGTSSRDAVTLAELGPISSAASQSFFALWEQYT
jgi:hypothetical protein